MRAVRRQIIGVSVGAAIFLGATTLANADTTTIPNMTISVSSTLGGTTLFDPAAFGSAWGNPNGTFGFSGQKSSGAGGWGLGWSMLVNPDPFVIANLVVTNTSAVTQTFTLTVTLPIGVPLPFGVFMGGSVTGTLTDMNGNGATLGSPANGAIYTALLDGVPVATLLDDPFSVSAGMFESAVVGPGSFGEPIPSEIGPAVFATMAITLSFTLTPGDAASFTSIFVIEDIPAPGVLAILVAAGACTGRRRRRA